MLKRFYTPSPRNYYEGNRGGNELRNPKNKDLLQIFKKWINQIM